MSHFLRQSEVVQYLKLGKPRAAVQVKVVKDTLVVEAGVSVLKADAHISPVPERVKVVSYEGKVVRPSKGKQFYVTVETFDPIHAVLEAGPEDFC